MDDTPSSQTSPTLLGRLRQQPSDQAAWEQFVERYGRLILAWCRQARLQDDEIEDVSLIVLIQLADKTMTFAYDPSRSFRGWLRTLTRHAWSDFVESRQRRGRGPATVRWRSTCTRCRPETIWWRAWRSSSTVKCWRRRPPASACVSSRAVGKPSS